MKKNMVIVNDQVFVSGNDGIKPGVKFTNNIVDIIVLEEIIDYLKTQIDLDYKELERKKEEREIRWSDYKKLTLFTTGISVIVPVGISLICGMHKTTVDSIFGETNGLVSYVSAMVPGALLMSQLLCSYGLTLRPSRNCINGITEKLNYQTVALDDLKRKINYLKEDTSSDKINEYEQNVPIEIDVDTKLKYYKDSTTLRFLFGNQNKRVMELYYNNTLFTELKNKKFDEFAILDFILFIEERLVQEKDNSLNKDKTF